MSKYRPMVTFGCNAEMKNVITLEYSLRNHKENAGIDMNIYTDFQRKFFTSSSVFSTKTT